MKPEKWQMACPAELRSKRLRFSRVWVVICQASQRPEAPQGSASPV